MPIPEAVPKQEPGCQAADLYAYSIFQYTKHRFAFELLQMFHNRMPDPLRSYDGRIDRTHIKKYLSGAHALMHSDAHPEGVMVPVPERQEIPEGVFRYATKTELFRRRRIK